MNLLIAGFLFVVGLIMLDDIFVNMGDESVTVVNETLTTVDENGEQVVNAGACAFNSFVPLIVTDSSDGNTIGSTNYTYDARQGIIYSIATNTTINNSDWNVTYTYEFGNSSACLGTNKTIAGQGKFGDYVDLIVLAIIITVVTSLILIGFTMRRVK